ncbi:DUF932 domain-containing protein [Nitratireductor sp. CAU 1489]|uniref:DUF932 domain-containing protein n=1 Tax=Nitratireductor arenosus TaxID=2682096 RepID=A0A844Q9T1_9HYPH|nr:DUF932 domain-containing protein [Nitratireductor arenosus]MVA95647.1 DUF932 domain-containing protein [Nitratireductor arenosus]
MTLILHAGATEVAYDELLAVATPPRTLSHVPVAHHEIVELMRYSLGFYGHEIVEEHHAVTEDGARYFGLLSLRSPDGEYADTLGLRNSHDKKFPIGIAFGSRVFVCDNLAFQADHVIKRKHTANAKRELPGLVAEVVEPLNTERRQQAERFLRYRKTALADEMADHAILSLYRSGVINIQRVPNVMEQWQTPAHDWGDKTPWRLFNAVTFSLTGRVAENPAMTTVLHRVIDGLCKRVR